MKNILKKVSGFKIANSALTVLKIGLPIILAYLVYIAIRGQIGLATGELGLMSSITAMLEHVMLGLALIVGGSILFDIAEKEKDKNK